MVKDASGAPADAADASNPAEPARDRRFQREIYHDLDAKLRSGAWNGGVSEAHGLLAGLACRGVRPGEIRARLHLLNVRGDDDDAMLLEGLFEMVVRELASDEPVFNLLLPGDESPNRRLAGELSDWCSGFIQGYCLDGDDALAQGSESTRELVNDMMEIGNMDILSIHDGDADDERSLVEIEEYLRVGVKLIHDDNTEPGADGPPAGAGVH